IGRGNPPAERVPALCGEYHAICEGDQEGGGEQRGYEQNDRAGQVVKEIRACPPWCAAQHERDQLPGLQMALEPAGPLPDQPPQLHDALLMHGGRRAVLVAPASGEQPHSQIEVIGQAAGPRGRAQRLQCGKPHELAVPAEAYASEVAPAALEDLGVDDEFHVLHPREPAAVAIVDADTDLYRAYRRVCEVGADLGDGVRVELSVRVHDDDDDVVQIAASELL